MSSRARSAWLLPVVLGLSCVEKFETPSAYDTQRFLCSGPDAPFFNKGVVVCRKKIEEGQECGGLISFKGFLEARPIVVESSLEKGTYGVVPFDGGQLLDSAEGIGSSPFFRFLVKFSSLGNASADGGLRSLRVESGSNSLLDPLEDDRLSFSLRVFGTDSVAFNGQGGELRMTSQSPSEAIGTFTTQLTGGSPDDEIEGCFMVYREATRIQARPQ